ncbi:MAG: HAD-IB family hydrolase [Clostridia bacterium]|nr:HAD-IB family hydrolase [Clostridia bacterium]
MMTKCAFFDFDDTLARGDSVVPFLLYAVRRGVAPKSQLLRAAWGFLTQLGRPGNIRRAKEHTFSFIKGKAQAELDDLARDFFREIITPRLFEDAIAHLWQLKSEGYTIVVVSASVDAYMRLLPEFLPVDAVLSTRCECVDGRYTGRVEANCKGDEKPRRIAAWLAENDLELDAPASRAYGDSPSDAPMLRLVGQPTLVNPGKKLSAALPDAPHVHWR